MSVNKSFISVNWTLTITIVIILVIGLVGVVFLFFPFLEDTSDVQRQRDHINKVNTAIGEVLLTGERQTVKFVVEESTMCIWYNYGDADNNIHILEIEYETASESFSTPVAWVGNIDKSDAEKPDCQQGNLIGSKTCTIDITANPPQAQVTC